MGVRMPAILGDVVTLSDLMLIDAALPDGATLEEAASHARPSAVIGGGERLAVAWELFGLGRRAESLSYRFSVEKADGGLLRTAGRMLGLVRPLSNQRLEWQEVGPDRPGPLLRTVEIELPGAGPGKYVVRLEIEIPGRTPLLKTKTVEIRPGRR